MTMAYWVLFYLFLFQIAACKQRPETGKLNLSSRHIVQAWTQEPTNEYRTIHVFVALCDNLYQGIVPVPASIGNGQDPENNLYWGCSYGIKTYFSRKSGDWEMVNIRKDTAMILETILFRHKKEKVLMLAEAYDGRYIKQTTIDFIKAANNELPKYVVYKSDTIQFGKRADIISYIGHDGLMDFSLPLPSRSADTFSKQAIILACYSRNFFSPHLKNTRATPLVWTTGLMAPEAYTLYDALSAWIRMETNDNTRTAAAGAYSKYQKCNLKAAKNLLVTGWE